MLWSPGPSLTKNGDTQLGHTGALLWPSGEDEISLSHRAWSESKEIIQNPGKMCLSFSSTDLIQEYKYRGEERWEQQDEK